MNECEGSCKIVKAKPNRKVFKSINKIPNEIANDETPNRLARTLPSNYNFELPKTIWRIRELKAKRVALQMPEGLLMLALTIADIIEIITGADSVIMGDVTYGACCIDDFTAKALKVDLLIHYDHSCLIPIDGTSGIKVLYIFVDIQIDFEHFTETLKYNFDISQKLTLVSTIQFVTTLHSSAEKLKSLGYSVKIPQIKPLSPGEILGCTAPVITDSDVLIYLGDGRSHLEAVMIANPTLKAYRYDPYQKKFTQEYYSHEAMKLNRLNIIEIAKNKNMYGLILGTLGRQGSPKILYNIQYQLSTSTLSKTFIVVLLSEIFPQVLNKMPKIEAWVQIACPRLSIDWGGSFFKPLLTPHEFSLVLKNSKPDWSEKINGSYPMDFYANESLGPWTPNYKPCS